MIMRAACVAPPKIYHLRCFSNKSALLAFAGSGPTLVQSSSAKPVNPRTAGLGHAIEDEYAAIRANYKTPKYPIVLAHGLLGFDELHLAGKFFPGVHYWRGITEALTANGIEVITSTVPASASIEERASVLRNNIMQKAQGKSVNIIAHSMGCATSNKLYLKTLNGKALTRTSSGLDSRYMISRMKLPNVKVLSLTTIATPHHGSAFADYVLDRIGPDRLPRVYKLLELLGMDSGAFSQLTRRYMKEDFNPRTPNREGVRYFAYGAAFQPSLWSSFRQSHRIIEREEGANDGLVSVASSRWGGDLEYKGTLVGVSHLDLINWTNRLRWLIWELTGNKRNFNAIAFYLSIADMLADEGY